MQTIEIKLMLARPQGTSFLVIKGEVVQNDFDSHSTAGILFASEFAINNHASEMLGRSLRAHLTLNPPSVEGDDNAKV
jgi:hypothetical protein